MWKVESIQKNSPCTNISRRFSQRKSCKGIIMRAKRIKRSTHYLADIFQYICSWMANSISQSGKKRRFLLVGVANVLFTNLLLQFLIYFTPSLLLLSTFLSQLFNSVLGYFAYGKFVFGSFDARSKKSIFGYIGLMVSIWILNSVGIRIGLIIGLSQSIAAIAMIPVLAIYSYTIQKNFVFKK